MKSVLIGLLLLAALGVQAQERPLVQRLLHVDAQDTVAVMELAPDTAASAPQGPGRDTTSVDYAAPDAGAPGSDRLIERERPQRPRSAARIGLGISLGLFSGLWISL